MPNIEEITYDTKESVRNEYDFRRELLSALKEDFSSNNEVKDTESYRQHILHALGQEFDQDDIKQTNNFRAKVVDGVKELVNGGGGGGDYPTITALWDDNTSEYSYSCNWSYATLKAKLEEQTESVKWAGVVIDTGTDGTKGGTWTIAGDLLLSFIVLDSFALYYNPNGTITEQKTV